MNRNTPNKNYGKNTRSNTRNNKTRRAKFYPLVGVKNTNRNSVKTYKGLTNTKNTRGMVRNAANGKYYGQESRTPIAIHRNNVRSYRQVLRQARNTGAITPQESHLVAKALEGRTPCDAIKYLYESRSQNLSLGPRNLIVGTDRLITIIEAQFGVRASDCIAGYNTYVNNNNASSVNVAYYNEENNRNTRPNLRVGQ